MVIYDISFLVTTATIWWHHAVCTSMTIHDWCTQKNVNLRDLHTWNCRWTYLPYLKKHKKIIANQGRQNYFRIFQVYIEFNAAIFTYNSVTMSRYHSILGLFMIFRASNLFDLCTGLSKLCPETHCCHGRSVFRNHDEPFIYHKQSVNSVISGDLTLDGSTLRSEPVQPLEALSARPHRTSRWETSLRCVKRFRKNLGYRLWMCEGLPLHRINRTGGHK